LVVVRMAGWWGGGLLGGVEAVCSAGEAVYLGNWLVLRLSVSMAGLR